MGKRYGLRNDTLLELVVLAGVHTLLRMCLIASLKDTLIDDNPVAFIDPTPKACLAHIINVLGDDD